MSASSPRTPEPPSPASSSIYGDTSGTMMFLGAGVEGPEEVSEGIRAVIREMMSFDPLDRPLAEELKEAWKRLCV